MDGHPVLFLSSTFAGDRGPLLWRWEFFLQVVPFGWPLYDPPTERSLADDAVRHMGRVIRNFDLTHICADGSLAVGGVADLPS